VGHAGRGRGDGDLHLFIVSTFPLAVPLEWNIVSPTPRSFLFAGFPAGAGTA